MQFIHLLRTTSKANSSITATLLVPSSSPSPEGIGEGLENRCLKRAYRFCWNPPCALGSKGKDRSCSRAPHWCTRHVTENPALRGHSHRSATIGSTSMARHAGSKRQSLQRPKSLTSVAFHWRAIQIAPNVFAAAPWSSHEGRVGHISLVFRCAPVPRADAGCPIQAVLWLEWDNGC
jgi:hypothetical protein